MLGLSDWPPSTTAATPKSRKIAARPSPETTATTAIAGGSGLAGPIRRSPGAWSGDAGELSGLQFADVARLVVEILDADPAQRPDAQAEPDDQIGSFVVDMDLDGPRIAGDKDEIADLVEPVADGIEVKRP